ncbi:MAG: ELWxxDGT repeat protein, partial [Thermoanaerobaculia bacterium]
IDLTGGWKPAQGHGDFNDDGIEDLLFVKYDSSTNPQEVVVNAILGSFDPSRDLAVQGGVTVVKYSFGPPGTKLEVRALFLNWNGDSSADLLVLGTLAVSGFYGALFSGTRLANAFEGNEPSLGSNAGDAEVLLLKGAENQAFLNAIRDQLLGANSGYSAGAVSPGKDTLQATIADLDGDGRDEALLLRPEALQLTHAFAPVLIAGRLYVLNSAFVPVPGTFVSIATQVPALLQDFALSEALGLGDLNRDGRDDFAVTRAQEGGGFSEGSVLLFYGSQDHVPSSPGFPGTPLRLSGADVGLRRFPAGSLPPGVKVAGPIQLAAGDHDDDGRADLAVGQTSFQVTAGSAVLDQDTRGRVHVVWNVASLGPEVVLAEEATDLTGDGRIDRLRIDGASDLDGFGSLPATERMDLDRDGYDDLFIGAPNTDALGARVLEDAGAIYALYGTPRRVPLPDEVDVVELANRTFSGSGDVLVDPATGRPVVFNDFDLDDDGFLDTSDFTLKPSDGERWYRFRLVGDGGPGNVLRLLPPAYAERTATLDGPAGHRDTSRNIIDNVSTFKVGGRDNLRAALEFDLSGLLEALEDADAVERVALELTALAQVEPFEQPSEMTLAGSTLYFAVETDPWGRELWKTDGTAAGTVLVEDIVPGVVGSDPQNLTAVGGRLFFSALI